MPHRSVVVLGALLVTEALGFALVGGPSVSGLDGTRALRSAASAQTATWIQKYALLHKQHQHLGGGLGVGRVTRRVGSVEMVAFDDEDGERVAPVRCGCW